MFTRPAKLRGRSARLSPFITGDIDEWASLPGGVGLTTLPVVAVYISLQTFMTAGSVNG